MPTQWHHERQEAPKERQARIMITVLDALIGLALAAIAAIVLKMIF